MARALVPDAASFTDGELATVAVARSLARIPCELTHEMLRENLDPSTTVVGLEQKVFAAAVFAEQVGDAALGDDVRALPATTGWRPTSTR